MTNCNDQISIYHILFCSERSYFKWTPLTTENVKTDFKDWVWMLSGNSFPGNTFAILSDGYNALLVCVSDL